MIPDVRLSRSKFRITWNHSDASTRSSLIWLRGCPHGKSCISNFPYLGFLACVKSANMGVCISLLIFRDWYLHLKASCVHYRLSAPFVVVQGVRTSQSGRLGFPILFSALASLILCRDAEEPPAFIRDAFTHFGDSFDQTALLASRASYELASCNPKFTQQAPDDLNRLYPVRLFVS